MGFIDSFFRLYLHQQIAPFNWAGCVLKLKYRQFCSNQSWRMYESACDRILKYRQFCSNQNWRMYESACDRILKYRQFCSNQSWRVYESTCDKILKYRQFCSDQSWRMYESACDRKGKKVVPLYLIFDFFIFLFLKIAPWLVPCVLMLFR